MIIDQVYEFHEKVLHTNGRPLGMYNQDEIKFACEVLHEEAKELQESHDNGDLIGCVDANIDSIYFGIGNLLRLGLSPDQIRKCFTVVHNKNMTKKRGVKDGRGGNGVADAVKPEGFISPEDEIAKILDQGK